MSSSISAANVKLKRAYEPVDLGDGTRILVDRLWPRGVSKVAAALDQWMKEIAPSTELRKWFGHDPGRWKEFCRRYSVELKQNAELLSNLRSLARQGPVTSAVTGLIAGEEVNVKSVSQDMLITHRNLNFIATVIATGLAIWRVNHRKPTAAYLGIGAASVGILAYTVYLGGKLVYNVGVGVEPAQGVYRSDAPALKSGQVGAFVKTAGTNLVHGVQHMVEEVGKGLLIPTIMTSLRKHPDLAPPSGGVTTA